MAKLTEEHKKKLSLAKLGKKHPIDCSHCKKIKGKTPWNKGLKGVQISWNKGKKSSDETKAKISLAKKGIKTKPCKEETKLKISKANKIALKKFYENGGVSWNKGKTRKNEKRISQPWIGKKRPEISGDKNWNWKGGVTPLNQKMRNSAEYKKWRRDVFEKDNYLCQICFKGGVYLEADHIKPFAYFEDFRLDINNGRSLCVPCHKSTETYGSKVRILMENK